MPLTHADNAALFAAYHRRPSLHLRNRIAAANWGLVEQQARRWTHQCSESFDDLCQAGGLGLVKAINKFNPAKGNAFSSLAVPYIRGEILHYIRDHGWGVLRIQRTVTEQYPKVLRAWERLIAKGREVTLEEVAIGLGFTKEEWTYIREARERPAPASIDALENFDIEDDHPAEGPSLLEHLGALPELKVSLIRAHVMNGVSVADLAASRRAPPETITSLIEEGLDWIKEQSA